MTEGVNMLERYRFKRELCRDPDGDYYLLETITDMITGKIVGQNDVDVLVYEIKGGVHSYVEYSTVEKSTETVSDIRR